MRQPSPAEEVERVLAQNLAHLRWLAHRVREASTVARRRQFLREFCRVIEGRFAAMEHVVVPEMKARGCTLELVQGVFVHLALRPDVARLMQEDVARSGFEEGRAADRLMSLLDHLQRECEVVVPCLATLLDTAEGRRLGDQVRYHLGQPAETTAEDAASMPLPLAPRARQS